MPLQEVLAGAPRRAGAGMSAEIAALRTPDACARCHGIFARPAMPGHNRVPAHFLKAATWAYLCEACAAIVLAALGQAAEDALPPAILLMRDAPSCPGCLKELEEAFQQDRESAARKVPHPKAVSRMAWCDECARIVLDRLGAPVKDEAAVQGSAT